MNLKVNLSKMQLMLLATCIVGLIDSIQVQRGPQRFLQPEIDYSAWSPIEAVEYPPEVKTSRARSIQASAPEPVFVPKTTSLRERSKTRDNSKGLRRRNFEGAQETVEQKPEEKPTTSRSSFKRRTTAARAQSKPDGATSRFKVTRTLQQEVQSTTPKGRRQYTPRSTSENVLMTTSDIPSSTKASLKRIPFTRGNARAKTVEKSLNGNAPSDDENYPEQFKLLLKNKEVNSEKDKSSLKKPLKASRPSSVDKTTKPPIRTASRTSVHFPARTKATTKLTSTTEAQPSTTPASVTPKRGLRRPRPTEKTKINYGSTLQEPPTAKSTPTYATRPTVKQSAEESMNVNTQADGNKQIDPPIREYFPRTSQIGSSLKYSSRFRNSDIALKGNKPSYQPTVPSITTTPTAFNDDGWEYSVTHPTHEKHYGSGSEVVVPPWHQSVIQPQWTFNGNRDHYSFSY